MSKIVIKSNDSGTGTFTIESPNSNTNRTLSLPDESGSVLSDSSTIDSNNLQSDVYKQDNIVGTVSQSSGVPTGAIIQRGSNANGEFVRYADGTQVATKTVTFSGLSLPPNGSGVRVDHLMAASFVGSPVFSYNGEMLDSGGTYCYGYFISGFGGQRSIFANTGNRPVNVHPQWDKVGAHTATNGLYTVMAIGRWF